MFTRFTYPPVCGYAGSQVTHRDDGGVVVTVRGAPKRKRRCWGAATVALGCHGGGQEARAAVGMLDQAALQQAKKAQGETNQRLDALLAEQQRTNELLAALLQVLSGQVAGQAPTAGRVTWGRQV